VRSRALSLASAASNTEGSRSGIFSSGMKVKTNGRFMEYSSWCCGPGVTVRAVLCRLPEQ
jgi:hypothetical protein